MSPGQLEITGAPLEDLVEVLEEIGRGSFGVVERGQVRADQRWVAVKRPLVLPDDDQRARLAREVRLFAGLRHPRLVRLLGATEDRTGRPALIYELVLGRPLDRVLEAAEDLPPNQVEAWVLDLAEALDALHSAGLVHRDLKPANVMVEPSGRLKLLDFGLARPEGRGDTLTQTGAILGTPLYMAPELLRGQRAGPATDRYALACIAYQLWTGEPPFRGGAAMCVKAHLEQPPPAASQQRPGVPRAFDQVFARALAKGVDARFPSAHAFAEALRRARRQLPPKAQAASTQVVDEVPTVPGRPGSRTQEVTGPRREGDLQRIPGRPTGPLAPTGPQGASRKGRARARPPRGRSPWVVAGAVGALACTAWLLVPPTAPPAPAAPAAEVVVEDPFAETPLGAGWEARVEAARHRAARACFQRSPDAVVSDWGGECPRGSTPIRESLMASWGTFVEAAVPLRAWEDAVAEDPAFFEGLGAEAQGRVEAMSRRWLDSRLPDPFGAGRTAPEGEVEVAGVVDLAASFQGYPGGVPARVGGWSGAVLAALGRARDCQARASRLLIEWAQARLESRFLNGRARLDEKHAWRRWVEDPDRGSPEAARQLAAGGTELRRALHALRRSPPEGRQWLAPVFADAIQGLRYLAFSPQATLSARWLLPSGGEDAALALAHGSLGWMVRDRREAWSNDLLDLEVGSMGAARRLLKARQVTSEAPPYWERLRHGVASLELNDLLEERLRAAVGEDQLASRWRPLERLITQALDAGTSMLPQERFELLYFVLDRSFEAARARPASDVHRRLVLDPDLGRRAALRALALLEDGVVASPKMVEAIQRLSAWHRARA